MIQGAWVNRDISMVRGLLTDEMFATIEADAETLIKEQQTNILDYIAMRKTEIVGAWQEAERDYVTVRFFADLLDYTIDDVTGNVIGGDRINPVKFEELWTFTRPAGANPWRLSAIVQPE